MAAPSLTGSQPELLGTDVSNSSGSNSSGSNNNSGNGTGTGTSTSNIGSSSSNNGGTITTDRINNSGTITDRIAARALGYQRQQQLGNGGGNPRILFHLSVLVLPNIPTLVSPTYEFSHGYIILGYGFLRIRVQIFRSICW